MSPTTTIKPRSIKIHNSIFVVIQSTDVHAFEICFRSQPKHFYISFKFAMPILISARPLPCWKPCSIDKPPNSFNEVKSTNPKSNVFRIIPLAVIRKWSDDVTHMAHYSLLDFGTVDEQKFSSYFTANFQSINKIDAIKNVSEDLILVWDPPNCKITTTV